MGSKHPTHVVAGKEAQAVESHAMATVTRYIGQCPVCYGDWRLRRMNTRTWPDEMLREKLHLQPESEWGLVHHGYQRPGIGFISGDCAGVGWPPWELSPNGNIAYVGALGREKLAAQEHLGRLRAGEVTQIVVKARGAWGAREHKALTPADGHKFDEALRSETINTENRIRWIAQDIDERLEAIRAWKPATLRTEQEEEQKRARVTEERRTVIEAARQAKRDKRAALDAKTAAREQEAADLLQEYRDIFNKLAFNAAEAAPGDLTVFNQAVGHWRAMHKRMNKKGYLHFYESELGIDAALVALKLAAPSRHRQGKCDYANDLGWDPAR